MNCVFPSDILFDQENEAINESCSSKPFTFNKSGSGQQQTTQKTHLNQIKFLQEWSILVDASSALINSSKLYYLADRNSGIKLRRNATNAEECAFRSRLFAFAHTHTLTKKRKEEEEEEEAEAEDDDERTFLLRTYFSCSHRINVYAAARVVCHGHWHLAWQLATHKKKNSFFARSFFHQLNLIAFSYQIYFRFCLFDPNTLVPPLSTLLRISANSQIPVKSWQILFRRDRNYLRLLAIQLIIYRKCFL